MISRNFIKSSIIYTLAGTLPMASAVILLPFYVDYLPTEVYGTLSIYLAFSMLLQIVITYSFDLSLYLFYHEYKNDQEKLKVFMSSAFVFLILAGILVSVIASFVGDFLFRAVFVNQSISFFPYGLMSVATAAFQAIAKVYSSLLQSRAKPLTYFWFNVISFFLIAGLTIAGLELYPSTLVGPVGGRMVASVVSGLAALVMVFREFGFYFDYKLLRSSFGYNRGSYIYQLQLWSMNYFDRVLLTFYVTMSDVGVYDFAMKCMLVIDFIIGGLYNSFYPRVLSTLMAQETKQSSVEINRYYHGLTGVVMLLVCLAAPGFMLLSDLGLIKSGYRDSIQYIPLIGVIYLLRSMRYYFAMPYGALKYSKPLPLIYLVVSGVKVLVVVLLAAALGVYSVLIATIISQVVEFFLLKYGVSDKFAFKFNLLKLVGGPAMLGLLLVVVSLMIKPTYLTQLGLLVSCVLLLWWLYRNELSQLKFFKSKK